MKESDTVLACSHAAKTWAKRTGRPETDTPRELMEGVVFVVMMTGTYTKAKIEEMVASWIKQDSEQKVVRDGKAD